MKVIGIRFATCTPMTYQQAIDNGIEIGGRSIGSKPDAPGYAVDYGYNTTITWWSKEMCDKIFINIDNTDDFEIGTIAINAFINYKFNDEIAITMSND